MESLVLAATVVLLSLLAPSASQEVNTTLPSPTMLELQKEVSRCAAQQRLQDITHNDVSNLLRKTYQL